MPKTQQGWRQLHGWIAHSVRFIWKGHELLALLKHLKENPTQTSWKSFLDQLQNSFLQCGLLPQGNTVWTIITDASKIGWGAVLLVGKQVIQRAHGL